MGRPINNRERRSHPRFSIDLPLEYQKLHDTRLRGAIAVNASERGFLVESSRDIPVGTELNMTVLFPKGYGLANFNVAAKIVRKEPYYKEDSKGIPCWEGYQYGLEFIQILEEDRWKLNFLLDGQFNLDQLFAPNEVQKDKETNFKTKQRK